MEVPGESSGAAAEIDDAHGWSATDFREEIEERGTTLAPESVVAIWVPGIVVRVVSHEKTPRRRRGEPRPAAPPFVWCDAAGQAPRVPARRLPVAQN